jgi:hypothetical protein
MFVLVALVVQYCGAIMLWYRRASRFQVRVWAIDTRNLEIGLGGLGAVICSLAISILNTEWSIENQSRDNGVILSDIHSRSPSPPGQDIVLVVEAFDGSTPEVSRNMLNARGRLTTQPRGGRLWFRASLLLGWVKSIYVKFRRLNSKVSNASLWIYPMDLQWDLELAYLLKAVVSIFVIPFDNGNYSLFFDPKRFLSPRLIYYGFVDGFHHAGYQGHYVYIMMFFYLLPVFTILLNMLLWIIASTRLVGVFPNSVQKITTEVDFWFRTGRTSLSIPISLLMFILFSNTILII